MKRINSNIAVMVVRQFIGAMLAMYITVLMAGNLTMHDNGIYVSLSTLPVLIAAIASFGISIGVTYEIGVKKYHLHEVIFSALGLVTILTIALQIAVYCLSSFNLIVFAIGPDYISFNVALLTALFVNISTTIMGVFQGLKKFTQFAWFSILPNAQFALYLIVFHLIGDNAVEVNTSIFYFCASYLTTAAIGVFIIRSSIYELKFSKIRSYVECSKSIFNYGAKAHLSNVLSILNYRLNYYFMLSLGGSEVLGLYSILAAICEVMWLVSSAASNVIFPYISSSVRGDRSYEYSILVARWVFYITLLMIASAYALIISGVVGEVLGAAYNKISLPFICLVPGILMLSSARVLANDIAGRGVPMVNTIIAGIALTTNILLTIVLVEDFKIVGAAVAASASYLILSVLTIYKFATMHGIKIIHIIKPNINDVNIMISIFKMKKI